MKRIFLLACILAAVLLSSCRKEERLMRDPAAKLEFSVDTVLFDTVFTSIGSATRQLKVYNRNDRKVLITSVFLATKNSRFRINVDGVVGPTANQVEIPAHDSIYVFVEVTVDPNNQNTPLLITDSIVFITNGNIQDVDLAACGQDAHFIVADTYSKNLPPYKIIAHENEVTTWINDKPYVVYGYAVVDSAGMLNIQKGCRIHFHKNSGLWVYRFGQLKVDGTLLEPVVFQGDRLEPEYREIPGQWDRIWINESDKDSYINHAIIKNGFIGVQAEVLQYSVQGQRLHLNNTVIKNMSGLGIFARFYRITAANNIISNCGNQALGITMGGSYSFRHCTFANYWSYDPKREPAAVLINNYNDQQTLDLDSAYFGNCIIYGDLLNEVKVEQGPGGSAFNYKFDHCLIKLDPTTDVSNQNIYSGTIVNQDPKFTNTANDYHLKAGSPAIDAGDVNIMLLPVPLNADIEGNTRSNNPDMGALESN